MAGPICPKCGYTSCSRKKREGPYEYLRSLFGVYPWECGGCRRTFTLQKRGKRKSGRDRPEDMAALSPLPSKPSETPSLEQPEAQRTAPASLPSQANPESR